MKRWQKIVLVICCLLGMGISFMYHTHKSYFYSSEVNAPVHVNIEINKTYALFITIAEVSEKGNKLFYPQLQRAGETIQNVVIYTEIKQDNSIPFVDGLSLHIPKEYAHETINAIDNISIFIGNKSFYFSHSEIINLQSKEQNGYLLYELPGLEYKKSRILALINQPTINWYGDFNLAVKTVSSFFLRPVDFIFTWCFLVGFLILYWPNIIGCYNSLRKQKAPPLPELLPLFLIILVGFILRFNGYVQYSSWGDELCSACISSNPNQPFMNTFSDPGNPPFYYILLRLWFMVFGWTEQSGRLLSVIIGSAALISLYYMVKQAAGKKAGLLAAAYMAVNTYLIGFSQEMRAYILVVFLVSIVISRFWIIIQKRDFTFIDLTLYVIPSILLVNTHYYGSLFIFVNFLFFVIYLVKTKAFAWRKIISFLAGNIIIACSLLPYFIYTALQGALFNSDFNTWLSKPGIGFICMAAFIPFLGIVYICLRRNIFYKNLSNSCYHFFDYICFATAAVYLTVFVISFYRSVLLERYLIILFPLLISAIAIIIIMFAKNSKIIGGLCIGIMFIWIAGGYYSNPGGANGVYQEGQAYISKDAEAHPSTTSMDILSQQEYADFYGYNQLPVYSIGDVYDVLYYNHPLTGEEQMYNEIAKLGIEPGKVLRIHVSESKSVFKIYR